MPIVKDIGLKKHLERYDANRKREQEDREKRERLARKTANFKAKTKYNKAKKSYAKSKGRRKTAGKGITLRSIFH